MAIEPVRAPIPFEKRTVTNMTGRGDLGVVTPEIASAIGCKPGVIRLLNGIEGRNGGFGHAHIKARREKSILGLGYRDIFGYVDFIARGFEKIAKQPPERLVFIREGHGLYNRLVCQWDDELRIWSVTTAIPKPGISDLTFVWPLPNAKALRPDECEPRPRASEP